MILNIIPRLVLISKEVVGNFVELLNFKVRRRCEYLVYSLHDNATGTRHRRGRLWLSTALVKVP